MLTWRASGYTVVKMQNASDKTAWSAVLMGPLATRDSERTTLAAREANLKDADDPSSGAEETLFASNRRHY
jgi:hypothetical protein